MRPLPLLRNSAPDAEPPATQASPSDAPKPASTAQQFWWPVAVGAVLIVLQAALNEPSFWAGLAVGGAVAFLAIVATLIRAVRQGTARADRLHAELEEHRTHIDALYAAALPEWLRVAIAHAQRTGRRIDLTNGGLRFADAEGVEIWTVPLPIPDDRMTRALQHRELHQRLGVDQLVYTRALSAG